MRRTLFGVGLAILAACGRGAAVTPSPAPPVATTRQPLIADPQRYMGDDLQDHELALTFDDGPGPMAVSGALAQWLHDHVNPKTGAPQPIQTTFFLIGACVGDTQLGDDSTKNQACDAPTPDADAVILKELSLGHYVGNHTATHRDLIDVVNGDEPGDVLEELTETDDLISKYLIWNRMFFRAPLGDYNEDDYAQVKDTAMNKYIGPIYWNIGGGAGAPPVTANLAADWACWAGPKGDNTGKRYSTRQCGDRYIKEIRAKGNRGIVLMHDAKGDTSNHDLDVVPGNTFDMLKYVLGQLEQDDTPWAFKRLDEVPTVAPLLPSCDESCAECEGPDATDCTSCPDGQHVDDTGACVAGAPVGDGGASDPRATTTSTGASTSGTGASSYPNAADASVSGALADKSGCNASDRGAPKDGEAVTALLACAVGLVISRRSKRLRT